MLEKTDEGPTAPSGEPNGPEAPPAPDVGASTPGAAALAAVGEPDTLPPVWCKKCQAEVTPEGKGRCPRCQTFVRLNFARRKHPVNVLRRQQLLEKLVVDYRPSTTLLQASCEQLAGILEQLETMKPGTPEHQRLVQLSQLLGATLEESRSSRVAPTPTDLSALNEEQLIERTTAILRHLLVLRDAKLDAAPVNNAHDYVEADPQPQALAPAMAVATAPEPDCEYCRRNCVGVEHHAYSVLHWNDPAEIKKRDEEATKVMMKMMPYGNPYSGG
jgi:hypothetical protein